MERCYWNKFSTRYQQCSNVAVGPRAQKLGNMTDDWVWCEEHGGIPERPRPVDEKADIDDHSRSK